jgi:hypothetical protein
LESLLQERNEAQPQIDQQPLQPGDASVPVTEWVINLRNELHSIPRPAVPDFEILYADAMMDGPNLTSKGHSVASGSIIAQAATNSAQDIVASLSLDDIEPSADFHEDAAFLQSTVFPFAEEDTWVPPPLPTEPVCDG